MTQTELKHARRSLKLTQHQLGERWGKSKSTINRWETGVMPIPDWVDDAIYGAQQRFVDAMRSSNIVKSA